MQVAVQNLEYNTDQAENVHANNEYVELIDSHPDEFVDYDWVNLTHIEYITLEFNRFTTPAVIEDLKVKNIFESKVKLMRAITEWFIKREVSSTPVKTNRSCYTAVCTFIIEDDNVGRDVCP